MVLGINLGRSLPTRCSFIREAISSGSQRCLCNRSFLSALARIGTALSGPINERLFQRVRHQNQTFRCRPISRQPALPLVRRRTGGLSFGGFRSRFVGSGVRSLSPCPIERSIVF